MGHGQWTEDGFAVYVGKHCFVIKGLPIKIAILKLPTLLMKDIGSILQGLIEKEAQNG